MKIIKISVVLIALLLSLLLVACSTELKSGPVEMIRLELIGVELDNLLDNDKSNPALRTPEEIEKIVSDSVKEWQLKVYELEHSEEYQNADEKQRMVMLRSLIKEDME